MKKGVFYDVKIALRVLIIYNAFIEEEVFACSNKSGKLNEMLLSKKKFLHVQIKVEN